jgi:hypothetical protein
MNMNEPPSLLRNDIDRTNHWLKVQLIGSTSNRSAIGATVICGYGDKKQAKAVMAQSSYLSANDKRLHFGLGSEKKASVEIRWPSGQSETLPEVAADQLVVIKEGAGIIRTGSFGR